MAYPLCPTCKGEKIIRQLTPQGFALAAVACPDCVERRVERKPIIKKEDVIALLDRNIEYITERIFNTLKNPNISLVSRLSEAERWIDHMERLCVIRQFFLDTPREE